MALKPRTPIFKSINGETDTGGAPIYADDLVRIQENNRADVLNYYEAMRRLLPSLEYFAGIGNPLVKHFENAIILSGLEYDNTNPAAPVVSEGYILSVGEVCYYPGGTIATGAVDRGLLYLYRGSDTFTARTFAVGGSKDILVTHNVVVEVGKVGVNGPELPVGTGITASDEVIVLGIGVAGPYNGEEFFTPRTAQGITEIGSRISQNAFVSASLAGTNTVGVSLPYLVSRTHTDGTTEIRGSVIVKAAAQTTSSITIATLGSYSIDTPVAIPLNGSGGSGNVFYNVGVNSVGGIIVNEPLTGWLGTDFEVFVNDRILGSVTLPTPYEYKKDFLNIT